MNRIGVVAAIVAIACGLSKAQERLERAGNEPALGNAARDAASRPAGRVQEMPASSPVRAEAAPRAEKPVGGWWDDTFAEREVPLSTILAKPEAWRDVPVAFVVQFHQIGKAGSSFFTRFEPDTWLGFSAWTDDAALWEKKAFESDFPHLFVRRDGADARIVTSAAIYDRLAVSGVVRDVIKGRPWIEVTSIRTLPEKMTEASLVHLVKGLTLRDHRRFEAAAREFEAADAVTLPVSVRVLGMREQAYALLNARKPKAAEERLLTALSLDPENADTALALTHIRDVAMTMPPERVTTVKREPGAGQPPAEEEEPVTPGPPDPLADRPKKRPGLPFPKASPADSRPGTGSKH
jgi:hypothetical protein